MNFRTNLQSSSHKSKENLPPSSKADAVPVQRATQRTVLGVLSENEQRGGRSLSQVSSFISLHLTELYISAFFQLPSFNWLIVLFSTGEPTFQTKFCVRQLPARLPRRSIQFQLWRARRGGLWSCSYCFWSRSGLWQLSPGHWNTCPAEWRPEAPAGSEFQWVLQLHNLLPWKTCLLFFAKLWFTLPDPSMQSDESLVSEEVLCGSDYAVDIHQYLRGVEVWNPPKKKKHKIISFI